MDTETDATPWVWQSSASQQKVTEPEAIFLEERMETKPLRRNIPSNIQSTQGIAEPLCDAVPEQSIEQNSLEIFPNQTRRSSENYEIMLLHKKRVKE